MRAGLTCLCPVFCARPGSGRGDALGGCPLGCLCVVLRRAIRYHGPPCRGIECCGGSTPGCFGDTLLGGIAAWLGACVGNLAWVGVVGAGQGLGLGLLVG